MPEEKQAAAFSLTLTGRAREAALEMSTDDIGSKEEVKRLLAKLDELYQVDKNQSAFLAYEEFEQFKRPHSMNIKDYINAFDRLNNRLIGHHMKLPEGVLAFRLLKGANLSLDTEKLTRATIKTFTYRDMSTQLKTIFGDQHTISSISREH